MPHMCCIPGCSGNYHSEGKKVSVFKFPKDDILRQRWIKAVSRDDYKITNTSVVCERHFNEELIVRVDSFTRDDGTTLSVPRKYPKLQKNSVPHIFPNQPAYRTTVQPPKRRDPEDRKKAIDDRDEQQFQAWQKEDLIDCSNFIAFCEKIAEKSFIGFQKIITDVSVVLYKLNIEDCPVVQVSCKILPDFSIEAWYQSKSLPVKNIKTLLAGGEKLTRWSQLDNVISCLTSFDLNSLSFVERVDWCVNCIIQCSEEILDSKKAFSLKFLSEQLHLHTQKQYRYSTETIMWAYALFLCDASAYTRLRSTNVLCLPHPIYLQRLSCKLGTEKSGISESHFEFLSKKASLLKNEEKIVTLMMDEIYVKPQVNCKCGAFEGYSCNANNRATIVQCFMLSSVLSKVKDVVALYPVCNLTGEILFKMTLEDLKVLTDVGFIVVALISDNNRVNRVCFEKFGDGTLPTSITSPFNEEQQLFFFFDTVHLLKCIRNNWFDQKDPEQSFLYPVFDQCVKVSRACVGDLKKIYMSEENNIVKMAPALSKKLLYPTSLQKQNVLLATSVFDEKNVVALALGKSKLSYSHNFEGTSQFLEIILKWWKIVNVSHPLKGKHLRDPFCDPIRASDRKNLDYLDSFVKWLDNWALVDVPGTSNSQRHGKLSRETHQALRHTTDALIKLRNYLFEIYQFKYVLLGKFQTDNLESRFGKYRQMSRGNYNVSVLQILESERKLKLLGLLKLKSAKNGEINIQSFLQSCASSANEDRIDENVEDVFRGVAEMAEKASVSDESKNVLIFIAGYVAYSVMKSLKCLSCSEYLTLRVPLEIDDSTNVYRYLSESSRGGLKWPTDVLVRFAELTYKVFQTLLTVEFEERFLRCKNHRMVLKDICLKMCTKPSFDMEDCEMCQSTAEKLESKCVTVLCNIFLNNYCKVKNDNFSQNNKRKLSTLNTKAKQPKKNLVDTAVCGIESVIVSNLSTCDMKVGHTGCHKCCSCHWDSLKTTPSPTDEFGSYLSELKRIP